jgi:hypothetical protein
MGMNFDPRDHELVRQASKLCSESERPQLEIQYIAICGKRDIACEEWMYFDGNPLEERRLYGIYSDLINQTIDLEEQLGLPS